MGGLESIPVSVEVDGTQRRFHVSVEEDVEAVSERFCKNHGIVDSSSMQDSTCSKMIAFHIYSRFAEESEKNDLHVDSVAYYRKMLSIEPSHREVRDRLAAVYQNKMNDPNAALVVYEEILNHQPNDIGTLLNIGTLFHKSGMMDKAIEFYEQIVGIAEEEKGGDAHAIAAANNVNVLTSAYNNLGLAYLALGVTDRAIECFLRTAELESSTSSSSSSSDRRKQARKLSAKQYLVSDLQASENDLSGAAETFLSSIRTGNELLGVTGVAKEALLRSVGVLGNRSETGVDVLRDSAAPQLVIFCPLKAVYGDGTWGPSSVDTTGIGGSEEAVILLSRELVRQGFVVRVYCYLRPDDAGRDKHDVVWLPIELFDPDREIADVFVSWRSYRGLLLGRKSSHRYLWLHLKVNTTKLLNPDVLESADGVFFVSQRERDRIDESQREILERNGVELVVTSNGLDPTYFRDGVLSRAEPRFIYASQPNYGLEWLLQMWPQIRREIPSAELDVYGDYPGEYTVMNGAAKDPYANMREAARVRSALAALEGVHAHGMVDQRRLADAFARASFWIYPTSTPETSCITAMKAQAMGAIPITSRFANSALPQTCGPWDMGAKGLQAHVWGNADKDVEARRLFVAAVVAAVRTSRDALAEHRRQMQDWARRTYSWRRVAKQWALVFAKAMSRQRASEALTAPKDQQEDESNTRNRLTFIFIWTTPPHTFTLRCRRAIESAFFHHPDASVVVYSNSLDSDMFSRWRRDFGYDIYIQRYDIQEMIRHVEAAAPFREAFFATLESNPIRYPNVEADLIRLLALLNHGGIYLDLDALVLRPMHDLRNVAAWEGDVSSTLESASQCAAETGTTCTIGNAVLVFDAKNAFLEECLVEWIDKYVRTGGRLNWEYAGAVLTDIFWRSRAQDKTFGTKGGHVRVLSRKAFYYYGQFGWGRFFNRQPDERRQYGRLLRESYVAHFWNHVHTYHLPETGSLMFHVLNDFRLQIGPPNDRSPEGGLVVSPYESL